MAEASKDSGIALWKKGAAVVAAGAAVAVVIFQLRRRQSGASTPSSSSIAANGKVGHDAPAADAQAARPACAPRPVAPALVPTGASIEAQRAAALSGARSPWAPDASVPLEDDIRRRLQERYSPTYLDIEDQGGNCGGGKIAIVMVSEAFKGQTPLNRTRDVQALFSQDIDSGRIHAVSCSLKTPEEYKKLMEKQQRS